LLIQSALLVLQYVCTYGCTLSSQLFVFIKPPIPRIRVQIE